MALFDIFQTLKIEQYKKTILQERYLRVLNNFHLRAKRLEFLFYASRLIVTIGSILVPAFLSIQGSSVANQLYWTTWVISLMVTISNGFMTLFKLDKKYFFINTTLEMLHSEGWQYVGLSGRYSGKESPIPSTHENQFLVFFHMAEKIKMRQVEEEYWKFTDTSGVGNATNQRTPFVTTTPNVQQYNLQPGQKNVTEQWVGGMKSDVLGLQPRDSNISMKVDGGRRASGISRSSEETNVSVQSDLFIIPPKRKPILQNTSGKLPQNAVQSQNAVQLQNAIQPQNSVIPQNTVVKVVHDESDVWSGAREKSRGLEQEYESEGES